MRKKCYIATCNSNCNRNQTKLFCIPQQLNEKKKKDWKTCQNNKLRRQTWITNLESEDNLTTITTKTNFKSRRHSKGFIM